MMLRCFGVARSRRRASKSVVVRAEEVSLRRVPRGAPPVELYPRVRGHAPRHRARTAARPRPRLRRPDLTHAQALQHLTEINNYNRNKIRSVKYCKRPKPHVSTVNI